MFTWNTTLTEQTCSLVPGPHSILFSVSGLWEKLKCPWVYAFCSASYESISVLSRPEHFRDQATNLAFKTKMLSFRINWDLLLLTKTNSGECHFSVFYEMYSHPPEENGHDVCVSSHISFMFGTSFMFRHLWNLQNRSSKSTSDLQNGQFDVLCCYFKFPFLNIRSYHMVSSKTSLFRWLCEATHCWFSPSSVTVFLSPWLLSCISLEVWRHLNIILSPIFCLFFPLKIFL